MRAVTARHTRTAVHRAPSRNEGELLLETGHTDPPFLARAPAEEHRGRARRQPSRDHVGRVPRGRRRRSTLPSRRASSPRTRSTTSQATNREGPGERDQEAERGPVPRALGPLGQALLDRLHRPRHEGARRLRRGHPPELLREAAPRRGLARAGRALAEVRLDPRLLRRVERPRRRERQQVGHVAAHRHSSAGRPDEQPLAQARERPVEPRLGRRAPAPPGSPRAAGGPGPPRSGATAPRGRAARAPPPPPRAARSAGARRRGRGGRRPPPPGAIGSSTSSRLSGRRRRRWSRARLRATAKSQGPNGRAPS